MPNSFRGVIDLWGSPDALAIDLGANVEAVRKWRQRDSIPADWWLPLVKLARKRRKKISVELLAALAAADREAVR